MSNLASSGYPSSLVRAVIAVTLPNSRGAGAVGPRLCDCGALARVDSELPLGFDADVGLYVIAAICLAVGQPLVWTFVALVLVCIARQGIQLIGISEVIGEGDLLFGGPTPSATAVRIGQRYEVIYLQILVR